MPDQKPPSTPNRIDKPLLRLASTGKKAAKRPSKTTGKPIGKPTDKPTHHGKLASRQIAYDILVAIEDGAQLDKALAANQDLPQLDERDRKRHTQESVHSRDVLADRVAGVQAGRGWVRKPCGQHLYDGRKSVDRATQSQAHARTDKTKISFS